MQSIVLFESLRNCKRRNKENFMSKSNSVVCGWGATLSYFKQDFNMIIPFFRSLYNILSDELNNIFHVKGLNIFTFNVKLINDRRKTKQQQKCSHLI